MTRLLLTIFFVGLVVSAASLALAGKLGVDWPPHKDGHSRKDDNHQQPLPDPGPVESRTIAWSGSDELSVNFPAEVIYIQGPQARIVATGPKNWIDLIEADDGEISLRGRWRRSHGGLQDDPDLKVEVHGPGVTKIQMNVAQSLVIRSYDQDTLELTMDGAGEVEASGRTRALKVELNGAGEGDFRNLVTAEADVEVNGVGSVTVAPTKRADLEVNGIGKIDLTTNPPELRRSSALFSMSTED